MITPFCSYPHPSLTLILTRQSRPPLKGRFTTNPPTVLSLHLVWQIGRSPSCHPFSSSPSSYPSHLHGLSFSYPFYPFYPLLSILSFTPSPSPYPSPLPLLLSSPYPLLSIHPILSYPLLSIPPILSILSLSYSLLPSRLPSRPHWLLAGTATATATAPLLSIPPILFSFLLTFTGYPSSYPSPLHPILYFYSILLFY